MDIQVGFEPMTFQTLAWALTNCATGCTMNWNREIILISQFWYNLTSILTDILSQCPILT